jgi:Fe-S cluster assembly protein SufD
MSAPAAVRQFEERGALLPGKGKLPGPRRAALARFEAQGWPSRKVESWRYTDLSPLSSKSFDYVAAAPPAEVLALAAQAVAGLALDPDATRLVFVDGYWVEALSSRRSESGLEVNVLGTKPESLLAGDVPGESALAALNRAFARDGAEILAASAVNSAVVIVVIGSGRGLAQQLRFRLSLARGARLAVVEHRIELADAGEAWLNSVTDIDLAENSRLEMLRLQRHGANQYSTDLVRVRVAADAQFFAGSVKAGGRLVRHELEIELVGPGAEADISGLALTSDREHCDTRISVDHRAPRTTSRQNYRSIANDSSRSVFNGKVTVREHAQHIDARQENHSLLLSARAEIDSKPELEIYADQVACSHGATVGELDDEALFYLRSRGIEDRLARAILTEAFAAAILDGFGNDDFRSRARASATDWLAAHAGRAG